MRKIFVLAAVLSSVVLADTVSTDTGLNAFTNMPANAVFAANTTIVGGNTPYWNNVSPDGSQVNVGYFLTNTGGFSTGVTTPAPSQYLATIANTNKAPLAFDMVRQATSFTITMLYQNSQANTGVGGTEFGIYDVGTGAKTPIYAAGTVPSSVGTTVAVNTAGISGSGVYGFYATTCQIASQASNCFTFYSDTALNPNVTNLGNSFVVEGPSLGPHQHFALFNLAGDADSFYLGYEDSFSSSTGFTGSGGPEHYGDFNDIIFRIDTTVPEPATLSVMGLGLLALGLVGRKRIRK
jgi:PEP-CTERM motif